MASGISVRVHKQMVLLRSLGPTFKHFLDISTLKMGVYEERSRFHHILLLLFEISSIFLVGFHVLHSVGVNGFDRQHSVAVLLYLLPFDVGN